MSRWAAERTASYIREESDPARPFFCMMSVFDPHNPYFDHPPGWDAKVDGSGLRAPVPAGDALADGYDRYLVEQMRLANAYPGAREIGDLERIRIAYHASVAFLDEQVGKVLAALEERGIARDTMVIFVSDHGDMLGDHGLFVKGAFFYEACVRVPLLIRYPGRIPAGLKVRHLVQPHQLAATILEAAGCPRSELERLLPESASLFGALDDRPADGDETVICTYHESGTPYQEEMFVRYAARMKEQGLWNAGRADRLRLPLHASMIRRGRYKLNIWHPAHAPVVAALTDALEAHWRSGRS